MRTAKCASSWGRTGRSRRPRRTTSRLADRCSTLRVTLRPVSVQARCWAGRPRRARCISRGSRRWRRARRRHLPSQIQLATLRRPHSRRIVRRAGSGGAAQRGRGAVLAFEQCTVSRAGSPEEPARVRRASRGAPHACSRAPLPQRRPPPPCARRAARSPPAQSSERCEEACAARLASLVGPARGALEPRREHVVVHCTHPPRAFR